MVSRNDLENLNLLVPDVVGEVGRGAGTGVTSHPRLVTSLPAPPRAPIGSTPRSGDPTGMPTTDRVSEISQVYERMILAGALSPGDLLPSEREISARMGVSRTVVREALGRLASLGLVRSVHGSGTRVAVPTSRAVTVGYQRLLIRTDYRLEDLAAVRLPPGTA